GSGLFRLVEKVRGVTAHTAADCCVNCKTASAAYAHEHINPCVYEVFANLAMHGLGPIAKFEHLPQHSNPPLRRFPLQHVDHESNSVRVGVVAIVQNGDLAPHAAFTAHRPWL